MPTYSIEVNGEPLELNINDTVYVLDDGVLSVERVNEIRLLEFIILIKTSHHTLNYDDLGKTFYIDRKDAETALLEIERRIYLYGTNID